MILVDTSAWILVFRAHRPLDLERLVDWDDVVTCLPVVHEVLQGIRHEAAFRRVSEAMRSLPTVDSPLGESLFLDAVQLYRAARRSGLTVRSSVDCLVAASAIRHDLEVLHCDRDYPALARVSPLRQRSLKA